HVKARNRKEAEAEAVRIATSDPDWKLTGSIADNADVLGASYWFVTDEVKAGDAYRSHIQDD
ncbi:MAG: hypothetical protein J2P28_25890, partial [Actinobacteria bacterium]|nr:hypothetical protein [Actinomycetota bacterium]